MQKIELYVELTKKQRKKVLRAYPVLKPYFKRGYPIPASREWLFPDAFKNDE